MGFSRFGALPQAGIAVRSGTEIATLVRRTYSLVFASVLVTIGGVAFAMTQPSIMEAVLNHRWIMLALVFLPLIGANVLRNSFPQNIGMVFLFTFAEGLWIAPFMAAMEAQSPGVASEAGLLTLTAFGALTAYAFMSRRDFSAWGGFLFTGLLVLVVTMIMLSFFPVAGGFTWIASIGVLLFSGLLVFDTWRIKKYFGPDDYVMAAVTIYLDLLNMFMFIISLLGGGKKN